jgi:hypothetical protein
MEVESLGIDITNICRAPESYQGTADIFIFVNRTVSQDLKDGFIVRSFLPVDSSTFYVFKTTCDPEGLKLVL